MLTNRNFTRILLILFGGRCIETFEAVSTSDRFDGNGKRCFEVENKRICYFRPNLTNKSGNWSKAWKICKEANSTLPIIKNRDSQAKLEQYLKSQTPAMSATWLAGKRVSKGWRWVNGKRCSKEEQIDGTKQKEANYAALKNLKKYSAENACSLYNYICQYPNSTECQSHNAIRNGNGCFVVYNNKSMNFYEARMKCLDDGGDLACSTGNKQLKLPNLHADKKYWIGLRRNWWSWNGTESNEEMNYSNWLKCEDLNRSCVYIDPNGYKWNQGRCKESKQILCQTVTNTWSQQEDNSSSLDFPLEHLVGIAIGTTTGLVIIVAFIITFRKSCSKEVNHPADDRRQLSDENPTRPDEIKRGNELAEMCGVYAEITRIHQDHGHSGNEPERNILYATLEFPQNKAVNKEPVTSSYPKRAVANASSTSGASGNNDQIWSTATTRASAHDGYIYSSIVTKALK